MCLMCEHYLDTCQEPECVADARERAEVASASFRAARKRGERPVVPSIIEEHYASRSGTEWFLWKGYSEKPCVHIAADHGPECSVVKRSQTDYGLLFDSCNCEPAEELGWVYY